jgi:hypothetical protein
MIAFRAKDQTTLLNTTEIKSSDYNTVKALVQGKIDTFLGFKFIRTQRLITSTDGSSIACLAWRKSALLLAVGQEPKTRIGERADKSYATQVYNCMSIGGHADGRGRRHRDQRHGVSRAALRALSAAPLVILPRSAPSWSPVQRFD